MSENSENIKEIIFEIGKIHKNWGLPHPAGEIWALLYLKGNMTQEQIKKELNCSLSSISQCLTLLEKSGLIKTAGKKGRKTIYKAETSIIKTKINSLEIMLRTHIQPMIYFLESEIKSIQDKKLIERLTYLKINYQNAQEFMNFMLKVFKQPKKLDSKDGTEIIKMFKQIIKDMK